MRAKIAKNFEVGVVGDDATRVGRCVKATDGLEGVFVGRLFTDGWTGKGCAKLLRKADG